MILGLLCLSAALTLGCGAGMSTEAGEAPETEVAPTVSLTVLTELARELNWTGAPAPADDLAGRGAQVAGDGCRAAIGVASATEQVAHLDRLAAQGLTRGLWHGWSAIIVHPGDPIGQPGAERATRGLIAWHCGPYGLLVEDPSSAGRETALAEALQATTVRLGLCPAGGTLLLLADTDDAPGADRLADIRRRAEAANWYYGLNGYGRVDLGLTTLDADGEAGAQDWYRLGPSLYDYPSPSSLAEATLARAVAGAEWPAVVYLERVVVIYTPRYPAQGEQILSPASTVWQPYDQAIELAGARQTVRLTVPNLVVLAADVGLGAWVHEMGHTLPAGREAVGGYGRLPDRYDSPSSERAGCVGPWDVMGEGALWGLPEGSSPTQMSAYTRLCAGWLHRQMAPLNREFTLTALENEAMGGIVYTLGADQEQPPTGSEAGRTGYYLLEARDSEVCFGAPECGVVLYRVTPGTNGATVVEMVAPQRGAVEGVWPGHQYIRPTLHGAADVDGAHKVTLADNLQVTLLAESFHPYRATIRVDRE